MLKHAVLNSDGKEVGSVELNSEVFEVKKLKASLVHTTVTWQRNARRAGTHSCLTKGVMKGGNRKPWKQKGTGRARAGSNTSPIWVGGAVAHGPHPRDYTTRVSARTRRQALQIVLSEKLAKDMLKVVDQVEFGSKSGKTKAAHEFFSKLGVLEQGGVFVVSSAEAKENNILRATRNLSSLCTLSAAGVNVYDLVRYPFLVLTKSGLIELEGRFKTAGVKAAAPKGE